MKKITKTIIALSVLAGLASCNKEQPIAPVTPEGNDGMIALTLTAGQENAETRAAIDSKDSKIIDWSAKDSISIFDGDNVNSKFTLKDEDAGKSSGKFSGLVTKTSESGYTALYPYQSGAKYNGTKISGVVLKSAQTATVGSFDPEAALMYAQSTTADGALEFKNIVGYVKFTTDFECRKITLISDNSTDVLAGTADITPGDNPKVSVTSGSASQVSLSPASGTISAGTYYIAIMPGKLQYGFRMIFTMTDGTEKYGLGTNTLEIKRSGVKNLGTISNGDLMDIDYKDLSESESANCYFIKEAGYYKFKAYKGNTYKRYDAAKTGTSVGTVASVDVLWESFGTGAAISAGELISYVSYNDGYVRFFTPVSFAKGNAVIAAKDAQGTILWSWHIWCSDEEWQLQSYNSLKVMMDRNLGATTATEGYAGSLGLFYQWGRKDPFVGASDVTSYSVAASTGKWTTDSKSVADYATKNPMTFYTGSDNYMPNGSWSSTKTVNDPCPAGYRVPDKDVWSTNSPEITVSAGTNGMDFGNVFATGETFWYPASGVLDYASGHGNMYGIGDYGYYWSVDPDEYDDSRSSSLSFVSYADNSARVDSGCRANGYSVRCQHE